MVLSALLLGCAAAGGCAGSARIGVVPLSFKKISEQGPLIGRLRADRCYHWVDDKGRLCVATAYDNTSLIGDYGKQSLAMSLVLGPLPAGSARNYRAGFDTLRMTARNGADHTRWASLSGIVAVRRERNGHIHGRFRLAAKQQKFHIALGWSSNSRVLLVGDFDAVPGQDQGRAIRQRTEAGGMERTAAAQPAVRAPPEPPTGSRRTQP